MLSIRKEQIQVLKQDALKKFENNLLDHIKKYFPNHWRIFGKQQLREVIVLAMERAKAYNLETEKDMYLFIGMMLYLGSFFDEDPMFSWVRGKLQDRSIEKPSQRIEIAYDTMLEYLDRVFGNQNHYLIKALKRISEEVTNNSFIDRHALDNEQFISMLRFIYPEKLQEISSEDIKYMLELAVMQIRSYGLQSNEALFWGSLMSFFLGCGYYKDPQFNWINEILTKKMDSKNRIVLLKQGIEDHVQQWLT